LDVDRLLRQALQVPPRSDEHLRDWIELITGSRIPNAGVCPEHDRPFGFVSDLFFHRVDEALVLANRTGSKTFSTAALYLAKNFFAAGFSVGHIGAIEAQARRCYSYYRAGLRHDLLRDEAPDSRLRETEWRNGSRIEILAGTEAATQGGHPHLTCFDELDQGRRQPFENAKGMPTEYIDADGKRQLGQFLVTSTRTSSLGLMQRALDDAETNGTPVYRWCALETMEACDGQDGRPDCDGEACPIWRWCGPCNCGVGESPHGRAVHADGWRSRAGILAIFRRAGEDTWLAHHLCQKPEAKALIYSNFGEANVTATADYVPGAGPVYIGYDWGFVDVTHISLYQLRDACLHQFDELVGSQRSEREWVREVVRRVCALPDYRGPKFEQWLRIWPGNEPWPVPWPQVWPQMVAGDPSAPQMRFELREHGLTPANPDRVRHNVEAGQDVVRAVVRTADGEVRLFVHPRCTETIRSFKNYRARQLDDGSFDARPDPDPANHVYSHATDAARYLCWTVRRMFGIRQVADDESADTKGV